MAEGSDKGDIMTQRIYLNDNWYFTKNYTEVLLKPDADLSELEKVRIPHNVCELSYSNFDEMSLPRTVRAGTMRFLCCFVCGNITRRTR